MKRSQTNKTNKQIIMLNNQLLSKLSAVHQPTKQSNQQTLQNIGKIQNDSLTVLLSKAKFVTTQNKDKIDKAKIQIKNSQKQKISGTFLTGLGLYTIQNPPTSRPTNPQVQLDHHDMLKQLMTNNIGDDLAELRRMIKQTDKKLYEYGKEVKNKHQIVINAADKFKTYLGAKLNHRFHQIDTSITKKKKQSRYLSSTNLKPTRYNQQGYY